MLNIKVAYGATEHSISHSLGISLEAAQEILKNYWKTYGGVRKYYDDYLNKAYDNQNVVITPHGLAIRAPELESDDEKTREKAQRSVLNALIQGLAGQLMVKRLIEMQAAIEANGMLEDVFIVNTIHDAVYFVIKDNAKVIQWVENVLIQQIMVKDYKEDQRIHNKAELEIGKSWDAMIELDADATLTECADALLELP